METATLVLGIVELLMVIALFYIGNKASKIDALEGNVTRKAEEVVDTRFRLLSAEFTGVMTQLRTVVEGIEKRLERGDDAFDRQGEAQRSLELQAERREGKMRNWAMETFGTRHEITELSDNVRKLEVLLAKFEERLNGKRQ